MFDLKRFRKDKKLTQKEIQDILGYSQSFISQVETGERTLPSEKLELLKKKYGDLTAYISSIDKKEPLKIYENILKDIKKNKNFTTTTEKRIAELEKENEWLRRENENLHEIIRLLKKEKD